MAAVLVQTRTSSDGVSLSTTPSTLAFLSPVTTGNAVIVAVASGADATPPIFGASDATNGAYSSIVQNGEAGWGRSSGILAKLNVTGGFTTVSVTASTTNNGTFAIYEVSGLSAATATSGTNNEQSGSTTVNCAAPGLSGTGIAVCAAMASAGSTPTPEAGYTFDNVTPTVRLLQHKVGTMASSQGTMTAGSAQTYFSVMAIFPESGTVVAPVMINTFTQ